MCRGAKGAARTALAAAVFLAPAAGLFAFDWPESGVNADTSFASQFAAMRGGVISPSLVFAKGAHVSAAGAGTVVAVLRAPDPDTNRFYSTLGNAVVVNHNDGFISVYGNLELVSLFAGAEQVDGQATVGFSGASGWAQGASGLEFQTADIRRRTAINPYTLMPRLPGKLPPAAPAILAVSRQDEVFPLQTTYRLPAGMYRVFLSGSAGSPYATTVSVNGVEAETIVNDTLTARDGRLALRGNRFYTSDELFPSGDLRLLAELNLARGRNTVQVRLKDISNAERQVTYSIDVY